MSDSNYIKFNELRSEYPLFIFEKYEYSIEKEKLNLVFHFNINEKYYFYPKLKFLLNDSFIAENLSENLLKNAIFNIGMIELLSYWKPTCSPKILIKPYTLNKQQIAFWTKLYFNGLGEFFYTNNIETAEEDLFEFSFANGAPITPAAEFAELDDNYIIPVGGGKDSVVSMELLKKLSKKNTGLVVNQRGATKEVLKVGNYSSNEVLEIERTIDPMLISLNDLGFLNGHTPFSALLAFVCSLGALLSKTKNIALSNESSANEVTIPGTKINHQYSKSFEFENDFRSYYKEFVTPSVNYFSFLRPLNELQIAAIFADLKKYHNAFKSCNAGSKTDIWCCNCSKCLFTYIILSPFLSEEDLISIFGENLYNNKLLKEYLEQLTGYAKDKPFECVGTIDEVNAALKFTIRKYTKKLPYLLDYYERVILTKVKSNKEITDFLNEFENQNFLDNKTESIVKSAIESITANTK
ncbi:MAG: hypothetical protein ACOCWC_00095 [Bacteroidota bacterium]